MKRGFGMSKDRPVELRELAVNDGRVKLTEAEKIALGHKIKRGREALPLTQPELARRVGVAESTVSNWERGLSAPKNRMGILLKALGVNNIDEVDNPVNPGEDLGLDTESAEEFLHTVDNRLLLAEVSRRFAHLPSEVTTNMPGRRWRVRRETVARTNDDASLNATESSG